MNEQEIKAKIYDLICEIKSINIEIQKLEEKLFNLRNTPKVG